MGFRFRKSIRLLPGLRLNLSKSGVSASIGGPGATLNISEKGTRATVGLPGTGLSYSEQLGKPGHADATAAQPARPVDVPGTSPRRAGGLLWLVVIVVLAILGAFLRR